ncbi:hypothetical protein WJX74_003333 [Apatococcus lobatus]|uniref:PPIase cyclophilin-type domain-containing protein n=1 Tax=Apatococcus lobatus TaxID=904363 RepID=A0AAW1RMW7_9CHLO
MSSIYNIEPPTQGKVVFQTTKGDIDIELWAKEAPKAVRNFVQLCLEGFYDKTPFHRILKGELAQGGDPTGTGNHSETVFGEPFKDEFHSRLRFSHRGMVACAGQQQPHTNGSQFFISLDATPWLDKKHTIFGKVTGESIFNVVAIGELETDEQDRPLEVPMVLSAEVIWNPFEDIVPRTTAVQRAEAEAAAAARAKAEGKKKAKKNLSLISFEDDEGGEEMTAAAPIRSAHDSVHDRRLVREDTETATELAQREELEAAERLRARAAVRNALSKQASEAQPGAERAPSGNVGVDDDDDDDPEDGTGPDENFEHQMRASAMAKRKAFGKPEVPQPKALASVAEPAEDSDEEDDDDDARPGKAPRVDRLSSVLRAGGKMGIAARPSQVRVENGELMTESQRKFKESKQRSKMTKGRDASNMERLKAFRATLAAQSKAAPLPAAKAETPTEPTTASAQESWRIEDYLSAEDQVDINDLHGHKLHFASGGANSMTRNEQADDYVVIDPRVAAQKNKLSKGQLKSLKQDGGQQWKRQGPVG